MNIDLGYLGKVVLEEMEPYPVKDKIMRMLKAIIQ